MLSLATYTPRAIAATTIAPTESYYAYPIEDVARLYSANFGEMRPNHFHSGVDIKSDGVVGKRVVAAADGYVSRLAISPYGYGLSIYVTHPNGTTTQYGHLLKFRDDIQKYIENERYRLKKHDVNIFLTEHQFPVKRGELIAYSGNSGSSSGPHLHFEVRESKEQRPLNPITIGAIQPIDKIKPTFIELYYIESKTIDGVVYPNWTSQYKLVRTAQGNYQIKGEKSVWVGREGHFVVAVSDRKYNVSNAFGVYSVEGFKDGECFYKHKQDGFLFANTRYSNSVSYYPIQRKTSNEIYRLRQQEGLPSSMIDFTKDSGMIRTKAGGKHKISIVACDDMGNSSTLNFVIRGKDDKDCFKPKVDPKARIARAKSSNTFTDKGIEVKIPAGTLYESKTYKVRRTQISPKPAAGVSGMSVHSAEYMIFDYDTPLHRAMEVSIEATIPQEKVSQAVMVYVDEKGGQSAIKGKYQNGRYTAPVRSSGRYFVASDSAAPTISTKVADGADLSNKSSIAIDIKDGFSGVNSYEATLDGEWIALDLKGSTLTHIFRGEPTGELHNLEVQIEDLAGNKSILKRAFRR